MGFQSVSYDESEYDPKHTRRPLMLGCSGGGGHIAAIQGIRGFFEKRYAGATDLLQYDPILYDSKPQSDSRSQIKTGVGIMHAPAIGVPIKAVVSLTSFPVLPDKQSLDTEIKALSDKEKGKSRPYIDMLLDVYPAGYESAAIWNVLQRNDRTSELKKLIDLQYMSDATNHEVVFTHFVNELKNAALKGKPYSEIISTQAMALPALCDAVIAYNKWLEENPLYDAPKVIIHQYMTDLPTPGAIHFFNALSTLNKEQQQQMKLYGVGMNAPIIEHFFPKGNHFNALYDIPARDNPMVRPGFKDPNLDHSSKFHKEVSITLAGEKNAFAIKAGEKIASIMLGSQASADTIEYIETLLENGMDKVFVFGGKNTGIKEKIADILAKHPEYRDKIIPLGNQGDKEIAPLMSRSNMVIIRGGGLSIMEQMAMNHNPEQTVLIHHANSSQIELTSGISWEDDNVKSLIAHLKQKTVHTEKTSPQRALRQIPEARLIAAVKQLSPVSDKEDMIAFIKKIPYKKLKPLVDELIDAEKNKATTLPKAFKAYFKQYDRYAQALVFDLENQLNKARSHLEHAIKSELETYLGKGSSDINMIIKKFDAGDFKKHSTTLFPAVQNYRAIEKLIDTLNPQAALSANKKLENLRKEFEKPETKKTFMSSSDGLFKRILLEIELRLAKYFPSFNKKLTFQQDFKKRIHALQNDENQIFDDNKDKIKGPAK